MALFPINQIIGSSTTLITSKGAFKSSVGSIVTSYANTAAADANPYISSYAGAMIVTSADELYYRNQAANAWIRVLTSTGGVPLSSITAAIATNTIDSSALAQNWQWNTLATGTAFLLSSTSTAASGAPSLFRASVSGTNSSAGQDTYAGWFENLHGGSGAINVAIYAKASGGATNYAFISETGVTSLNSFASGSLLNLGGLSGVGGTIGVGGSSSGIITLQPQAAAGTWNWNWPITAGTAGQVLTSQGGGGTAMTWTSAGSGTVTSFTFTDGNGFDGTVTNSTTTPTLSLTTTVGSTQVMYSNSGAIAGSTQFTFTGQAVQIASTNTIQNSTSSILSISADSLTSGQALFINSNSLTNGRLAYFQSSTTAASTGSGILELYTAGTNAASSVTTYGLIINNVHAGTSSTNVAGIFSSTGGTNNYAIIVPQTGGWVGIGNSTPTSRLTVADELATTGSVANFYASNLTSGNIMSLVRTGSSAASGNEVLNIDCSGANSTGSITNTGTRISVTNTGAGNTNVGLDIAVSGGSTNYAAILNGDVEINGYFDVTSPNDINLISPRVTIIGDTSTRIYIDGSSGIFNKITYTAVNGHRFLTGTFTIDNLAGTGSRTVLASAAGLLSAPVSDITTKQFIQPLEKGLDTLMKLNPVSFEYKNEYKEQFGEGAQIGFIAQDIHKVLPGLTYYNTAGITAGKMGYNEIDLVPILTKAIQEQQEMINDLRKQIEKQK